MRKSMPGVAHALLRAASRLISTPVSATALVRGLLAFARTPGVHTSVNAARWRACATRILAPGIVFAVGLGAQEGGAAAEPSDPWLGWKWANFAILALGLGYLIYKHVPALFAQRSQEIQKGILEAAQAHQEAEERAAKIERRLAGLETEVESLRAAARSEMAAEGERIKAETERRLRSIQEQAKQEIALMSRGIREELRNYSAGLALDLAEQRIRARMNPETEERLVDGFVQDLRHRLRPEARN